MALEQGLERSEENIMGYLGKVCPQERSDAGMFTVQQRQARCVGPGEWEGKL